MRRTPRPLLSQAGGMDEYTQESRKAQGQRPSFSTCCRFCGYGPLTFRNLGQHFNVRRGRAPGKCFKRSNDNGYSI